MERKCADIIAKTAINVNNRYSCVDIINIIVNFSGCVGRLGSDS